ncbi:hypothetical protein OC25_14405 [Pedobacter kyungheensis]|uniref:Uncharacterized protein n=2 Tax=Pedobacter TaxID=84567 RepID=A0A1G6UC24_9SPHI|nr:MULTISPECIES: hypothetical protein [Pedobacter]KIA93214.1 hypothetical protein OC25_14405 [Pedobacter kyungheensis]SDD38940.1 hypothetical protein SAMN04488024_105305 [Pedobacter soli]
MTQKDENYLTMATVTLQILNANRQIWTDQTVFCKIVGEIEEDLMSIGLAINKAGVKSMGATVTKYQAANAAIAAAVKYSGLAQIHALEVDDNVLFDALRTSATKLERLTDQQLIPALEHIYSNIAALTAELKPYGLSEKDLQLFQKHINNFKKHKDNPRVVIAERKGYNDAIPTLLIELKTSFFKLDRLIKIWESTNVKFVNDYENARIVIKLGARHKKELPTPAAGN